MWCVCESDVAIVNLYCEEIVFYLILLVPNQWEVTKSDGWGAAESLPVGVKTFAQQTGTPLYIWSEVSLKLASLIILLISSHFEIDL